MARCKLRPFKPATFSSMSSTGWYQVPRFSGQGILVRLWHATDTGMLKFTEVRSSTATTIRKCKSEESSKYKHACAHTHVHISILTLVHCSQVSGRMQDCYLQKQRKIDVLANVENRPQKRGPSRSLEAFQAILER